MAAFTLKQYRALCEAIAGGVLVVQYNNRRVQYRSLNEMLKAKALMEDELLPGGNDGRRHRAILDKGL